MTLPKGVYRQRKRLAGGDIVTYYRWRATGARIEGEPGTPEFAASLALAKTRKSKAATGTWAALIEDYRRSPNYRNLRPNTQKYYDRQMAEIKVWASRPVAEMKRPDVLVIRDGIASISPQSANQFVIVMSVLADFAVERGYREANPLVKIRRIKGGSHAPWPEDAVKYALANFAELHRRAIVLALYTGQREGDCCRMTWAQYDGTAVAVVQEKTGTSLWIPAHRILKKELDAWKADSASDHILTNSLGRPWPTNSFAVTICGVLRAHPRLDGLVFHGLRKAAAVRLAEAGCSTHEIAAITGHATLSMIELYTRGADQKRRAVSAIHKLELVPDDDR